MIKIPPKLNIAYSSFIKNRNVQPQITRHYMKWLRYYLDYCHKYNFNQSDEKSLLPFLKKLEDKKQAPSLRDQAQQAILLFFEMEQSSGKMGHGAKPPRYAAVNESLTVHSPFSHSKEKSTIQAETYTTAQNQTTSSPRSNYTAPLPKPNTDWTDVFEKLSNAIQIRHYSPRTLRSYTSWTRKFQAYVRSKDHRSVSVDDVKAFLTWLAVDKGVSASSQNLAFNALLFLFRNVFGKEFGKMDGIVRAKRRPYIPVVLSRSEVDRVIGLLQHPYQLIISLMYGCGLRISECLSLRVSNFNFDMQILTIHDGKGKKDRTVPIPQKLETPLKDQLAHVMAVHEQDLLDGFDGVFLHGLLEKKYINAARELVWQWFFPAKGLTFVKASKENRRYHIHETSLQKALRSAVKKSKIPKRVTSHTFRHSFASHLLQANFDIRTIQQLMGHSDVRTTMIYTHTVKSTTLKEAKSPLDF